ncbi:hypothetical protein [Parasphingorhabdus sp.]|uniref:hypothetical protein n=1 Tax=Parasphingorhabdus sp. TaxID=2709688 RepID=UPI0030A78262|nr:hypothetical protein [Sphingomonadales bacterium]
MKTLLLASLVGIFAVAPASTIAAIYSAPDINTQPSVDISFAWSTAMANPAEGAKAMPHMGNNRQM